MSTLSAGLRLHDRYVLVERIGVGGMAEVWRADDEVLDRPVAVKVLDAAVGSDATIRIATHREARAAARLNHPHITRVYDYGEAALPGGTMAPYLVMELLDGKSLAERLASGPVPWPEAARIAAQVAAGLAAAHASGIVHCDIKPGNVMLTPSGGKILDFGVASLAGRPDTTGELIYGTPGYLPPERMAGAPPQPAGDVYALGVLLAEMVTGRQPEREPAPLRFPAGPGLPPALARLGSACLATDPADRPLAAQVSRALAAAAGTLPAPTVATAPTSPAPAVAAAAPASPAVPALPASPAEPRPAAAPGVPAPRAVAATMVARAGAPVRGRAAVVPKTPPVDPSIGWVEDLGPPRRRGPGGGMLALGVVAVLVLVLLVGMLLSRRAGSQG
ncbi:MAG TPA: serine/threonine-protein kinase, partial [Asanoa sp.]